MGNNLFSLNYKNIFSQKLKIVKKKIKIIQGIKIIMTSRRSKSISLKIVPKIFDDIGHNSGGLITIVFPTTKLTS